MLEFGIASRSARLVVTQNPRHLSRGFTLVELLAVVTIVGILALISLASFRKHALGSRSTEALAMIQSIRSAEERYKSENLTYLNVSTGANWFPAVSVGRVKRSFYDSSHADFARWRLLNPAVTGPVEFGYLVNAGAPGVAMTPPQVPVTGFAWPASTEHWYVIQASADGNSDGVRAFFMSSHIKADIFRQDEGE